MFFSVAGEVREVVPRHHMSSRHSGRTQHAVDRGSEVKYETAFICAQFVSGRAPESSRRASRLSPVFLPLPIKSWIYPKAYTLNFFPSMTPLDSQSIWEAFRGLWNLLVPSREQMDH